MSSYVCASLGATGECEEWVQTWSPLALSYADGAQLAAAIVACWALAWGIRLLVSFLLNR